MEENIAEAERLAPGDGAALVSLVQSFGPYLNDVFSLFAMDLTSPQATETIARLLRSETGQGYSPFAKTLFDTGRTVVSRFRSPVLQAMLAPWSMHLGRTPDEVGSGLWVILVILALMGGGMAIPEGGSEQLALALAGLITSRGGRIRTNTSVSRILVEQGSAVGVRTVNGEEFRAKEAVVASVNPDQIVPDPARRC